ncbi:vignain-like, partial [Rutidosis leptorrhynchoides]|uniref:vignain-like n=1 Tax=Rutidosis leptorrhynchoides TaxID=125765 RepID=UPI003A9A5F9D
MEIRKSFILLALSLVLIQGIVESFEYDEKELESEEGLQGMYDRWRTHHNIEEVRNDEKAQRFNVFKANVHHVHKSNKMDRPYKLSLNKFAAMTNHEFRNTYAGSKISHYRALRGVRKGNLTFMYHNADNIPPSVDWRERNAVTPPKDQGKCGSCWAFSTVVAVEGINAIKTGQLVSLSEQHLIDCNSILNNGCDGGLMEPAFEFIKTHGGLATEQNYPYTCQKGICDQAKIGTQVVTVDGFENVPECDEEALLKAVAHQPVSIAIEANGHDMQFYSQGVFTGQCTTEVNHGVAIVGYGETPEGIKYWIVKNSWGPKWGEGGFIRVQRGVPDKKGVCGVAVEPSYPTKTSPHS